MSGSTRPGSQECPFPPQRHAPGHPGSRRRASRLDRAAVRAPRGLRFPSFHGVRGSVSPRLRPLCLLSFLQNKDKGPRRGWNAKAAPPGLEGVKSSRNALNLIYLFLFKKKKFFFQLNSKSSSNIPVLRIPTVSGKQAKCFHLPLPCLIRCFKEDIELLPGRETKSLVR